MLIIQDAIFADEKELNGYEFIVAQKLSDEISKPEYEGMSNQEIADTLMAPQEIREDRESFVQDEQDPTIYRKVVESVVIGTRQPKWCDIVNGLAYVSNFVTKEDLDNLPQILN